MTRRKPARAAGSPISRANRVPAAAAESAPFVPPYRPSWINRLAARVDEAPGPFWIPYLFFGLVLVLAQLLIQWNGGTYPFGTADWFNIVVALAVPYELGLMHYLLRTAAGSFDEFRPALRATPVEAAELKYRLSTAPARAVLLAGLGVAAVSFLIAVTPTIAANAGQTWLTHLLGGEVLFAWPRVFRISPSPLSIGFTAVLTFVSWWTTGAYAYLVVHQLRQIDRIYTHHTRLRLFRLGPLYAFSRHTLRSAVGLLILAYALFATAPEVVNTVVGGGSWLLLVGGGVATFLIPLLGIHRLLVAEKNRQLDEVGARVELATVELHRRVDANDLDRMDDLNKALASLESEGAALDRVATWPWERGTLRSLIAAILIPLIIWAIQALLQADLAP